MKTRTKEILPLILFLLVLIAYTLIGVYYAHHLVPTMDEGTYLLKGRYYLQGQYYPYQVGGPLTNKLPFSFYLLGISQLFEPGLASGRYLGIVYGLGALIGLWFTGKKYSSGWLSTIACFLMVLSQATVMYFSRAMTQPLTSFLIIWSVYFLLGKNQKKWQLTLGLLLAAVSVLTRQNLAPFYLFVVLYVLWENGFKKSSLPILLSIAFFVGYHVYYWPKIFEQIWLPLLPGSIQSFFISLFKLSPPSDLGTEFLQKEFLLVNELQVVFETIRYSLIPILYSILVPFFLDKKKLQENDSFKPLIFVYVSFVFLTIIHLIAPIQNNNFLYSMPAYIAFFIPLGLLLIPLSFDSLKKNSSPFVSILLILITIVLCTGVGLSLYRMISGQLMEMMVPRVSGLSIKQGTISFWRLLQNKYGFDFYTIEYIVPAIGGFVFSFLLLAVILVLWLFFFKKTTFNTYFALAIFGIVVLFTPSKYIAKNSSIEMCYSSNIIHSIEAVSKELDDAITPNSLIYYETKANSIPLLYIDDVDVFPNMLNQQFYYRIGGNDAELEEAGFWNESLARKWIDSADYLVLGEEEAKYWEPQLQDEFTSGFDKLMITNDPIECHERSWLHVYQVFGQN